MSETERVSGATFVCECPQPVKELKIENGCVIAILEDGEKFVVPVEAAPDVPRN